MSCNTTDHERIWLEPRGGAAPNLGRLWCQDDVWTDDCEYQGELPTEYVRADLYEQALARVAELERDLEEGAAHEP